MYSKQKVNFYFCFKNKDRILANLKNKNKIKFNLIILFKRYNQHKTFNQNIKIIN